MKSLSKSQYTRGLQCHKSLWLYRHRKDLRTAPDEFQQSIFDSGTAFGLLAHQRFGPGVLIAEDHTQPEAALAATEKAIADGAVVLFEAAFIYKDVLVRVDVMRRVGPPSAGNLWEIIEVKSTTEVEETHLDDVAIQRYVIEGAGHRVAQTLVAHANPAYVRRGELDLEALFAVEDVTKEAAGALAAVPNQLEIMKGSADMEQEPPKAIGSHCMKPHECDFKAHCWAHVPSYSVFNLAYAKMEKKLELFNSGVQRIDQINPQFHKLTAGQKMQIMVAKAGKAVVDRQAIKAFLETLTYPLAHLDFETANPVIPPYNGLRPYSQMPFQASVRVQKERGGPLTEQGFLGDGLSDPRESLIEFLGDVVPSSGSVLAYHKSFEEGRLKELMPDRSVIVQLALKNMAERLQDLADPFRTGQYAHPDFKGRWSIKAVLPVLVPSMTYEGLEIGDGAAAMAAYARLRDPQLPKAERERLMKALKIYCGQDTLAMVKILEHLYERVES